ncbi:MAG: peptidylprolyl isomerase [Halioglobus sp.]|nr:peptidylprolyl isomerase [Halioglobus sp.]
MSGIVKIDDEVFSTDDFIKLLKLDGRFENLMEDIVRDKLAVRAAKKSGIVLTDEEIQEKADQYRRVHGLHRARDTNDYLDALGVSLDDFESFLMDMLYHEKVLEQVTTEDAIEEYFQLHSPRFDSIEVSHIVMDSEGGAREMLSYLADDPESFREMAAEHSVAETASHGGRIGKVLRGSLQSEIEARVFNAEAGDLLGPFPAAAGTHFEIFRIDEKRPAALDEETRAEVVRLLRDEWLLARSKEHSIEML